MKAILFGATGMVGRAVLRECLLDPGMDRVLAVGRSPSGQRHDKLRDLVLKDFADLAAVDADLAGYDACFYCLGVTSAGMSEADYTRVTYDLTMAAATPLARVNPDMTFVYVSGAGTDSSEKGGSMWARVKGKTENALLALPFKGRFMFRPGFIQPMHGIQSKTSSYRILYRLMTPFSPILRMLFPSVATTTERIGRAMLKVARDGAPKNILETSDINQLGGDR
ncbi:MAG TPA: NAD(P)H-binding protein [Planctomycetota bacterium]|nr:NAD(P)H-binding protein [Planctomycetota bacterium]